MINLNAQVDQLKNYLMEEVIEYLQTVPNIKNVALQFDENLYVKSIMFYNLLRNEFKDKFFFVVGETSYGLCCADDIAALHLKAELIIRVGESCLTKNKQLPVYFVYENDLSYKNENNLVVEINKTIDGKISEIKCNKAFVFYQHRYTKLFQEITPSNEIINISTIPYKPSLLNNYNEQKDLLIYSRLFKNSKQIQPENDIIIFYGEEDDKVLAELSLRYINTNKIYLIKPSTLEFSEINSQNNNKNMFFYKRFNLIEKAKESETFGILIGSLSIFGLNEIIEDVKKTLKYKGKKYYTFLLGKITLEKLSNFVDYIDCFVLIACPFSTFYNFKTLMRPVVNSLDIKIAFDDNYKWDMSYSFDTNFILHRNKPEENTPPEDKNIIQNNITINSQFTGLKLKESEKNQALANIFSLRVLQKWDDKKYKGLDIKENIQPVKKFEIGRTGIPIKYEDIKDE